MSESQVQRMMERYLDSNHEELSMLAEHVVFTTMATGTEHTGRDAVAGMLHFMYHEAFDAHAERRSLICTADHAVLEATFVGRHIGEFADIPATGKTVRVPLCVVYDIDGGQIVSGRVYIEMPVMMAQLNGPPA